MISVIACNFLKLKYILKSHPPTNPLTASISIEVGFPKSELGRERGEVFGKRMTSVSNKRAGYTNLKLNERNGSDGKF